GGELRWGGLVGLENGEGGIRRRRDDRHAPELHHLEGLNHHLAAELLRRLGRLVCVIDGNVAEPMRRDAALALLLLHLVERSGKAAAQREHGVRAAARTRCVLKRPTEE